MAKNLFYLALFAIVASSVLLAAGAPTAAAGAARWQKVGIPAGGQGCGWVLASGSDIECLHLSSDGTLYTGVSGLTNT